MPDLDYLPVAEILVNERGKKGFEEKHVLFWFISTVKTKGDNLHVEGITVGSFLFFKPKFSQGRRRSIFAYLH